MTNRGIVDFSVHNLDTPVKINTPVKNNDAVSEFIELAKFNDEGKLQIIINNVFRAKKTR